jgi:hypothetical protein
MTCRQNAAPSRSILRAMDHAKLFGSHFRGPSWDAWRAFLAALFALRMSENQLAIYRVCTGRTEAPTQPFREAAMVCGRRGGKSRVLALLAVYVACFIDHAAHLAAGEVATVAVIASDRRQARTVLRYILGLLRAVPALAATIEGETAESVTLTNSVVLEVHTASYRVTRGYTLAAVLADEIAFWPTEDSANPDLEIIRAVRPGLASLPHSLLLLASSPYARRGVLWNTYRSHFGKDDASVLVWQASTERMNPTVDQAIIAEAREEDPAAASSEYDAQFRDDIAAFVSREIVHACTVPGRFEVPPMPNCKYHAFVDPSGGSADSMTLAISHAVGDAGVMLDAVREVRPLFSPEDVVTEFATLLQFYGLSRVTGDRYAGEWPRERFRVHGITYDLSEKPKREIYRDVLPMLNAGRCELLDLPRLATQFCGLERRTARGGRDSIDHGPGGHDDVANAAAGALLLAEKPKVHIAFVGAPMNGPSRESSYMQSLFR